LLLSKIINKEIKLFKRIENEPRFTGIDYDSRNIKQGMIFAAIEGIKDNGINFCNKAIEAGANTILCDKKYSNKLLKKNVNILTTKNVRLSISIITKKLFPNQPKNILAITGTNGKTSIAFYLKNIWKKAKINGATIGTLGIRYQNKYIPTQLTTPDPITLHRSVDFLKKNNINYVALEASSHGLKQNRLDSLIINRGIFSNLSRDHLDYHKNLDDYFESKKRLFSEILKKDGLAIVNKFCRYGKKLETYCKRRKIRVITYGATDSDWIIKKVTALKSYSKISIAILGNQYNFTSKIKSHYQLENLICAMIAAHSYNIPIKNLLKWVQNIKEPPGRLEKILFKRKQSYIYIDYAHTPVALKKSLIELRKYISEKAKLKVLFGCGGNRDQGKRRLMGKYAFKYADEVYITDDNPRFENPKQIRNQILKHCIGANVISNREKAIQYAIKKLKKNEILLVAGKGHEKYQEIKGKRYFFDDKKVVVNAIKSMEKVC